MELVQNDSFSQGLFEQGISVSQSRPVCVDWHSQVKSEKSAESVQVLPCWQGFEKQGISVSQNSPVVELSQTQL
jgi:hypothetical protein